MGLDNPKPKVVKKPDGTTVTHIYGLALSVPVAVRRRQAEKLAAAKVPAIPNQSEMVAVSGASGRRRPTITKATVLPKPPAIQSATRTPKRNYVPILPKPATATGGAAVEDYGLTLGNLLNENDGYVPWRRGMAKSTPVVTLSSIKPEPEVIELSDSSEVDEDGHEEEPPEIHPINIFDIPPAENASDEFESGKETEEEDQEPSGRVKFLPWGESTLTIPIGLDVSEVENEEEEEEGLDETFGGWDNEEFSEGEALLEEDDGGEILEGEDDEDMLEENEKEQLLESDVDEEDELPPPKLFAYGGATMHMPPDPTVGFDWEESIENIKPDPEDLGATVDGCLR